MTLTRVSFTCDLPPSANNLFANARGRGRVKTGIYKAWLESAGYQERTAWMRAGKPSFEPPLVLSIEVGINRQRDASNCIKPIEDMLVACIPGLPDDRHNDIVTVIRAPLRAGHAHVEIAELRPAPS